jgi:hypothetical protein
MKNLFKNCLTVREQDGWLLPIRFTEKQMQIYSKTPTYEIRSFSTSSVILSFKSNAKKLSFDFRITKKARDWAVLDVVCDGLLRESVSITEDSGHLEITLSGDARVETHIYLPQLVCFEMKNISSDKPLIPTEQKKKTWLALGDSITQGMVANRPSGTYPSLLSEKFGCNLINAGVGGIIFNAEDLDYIGFEPDFITVALGCNDWGTEKEAFRKSVSDYMERLTSIYKCKNIHLILPIFRSDGEGIKAGMTFAEHREIIREVASCYPFVNIIDGYTLVPHIVDFFGDPSDVKVHPNDEGFLRYALSLTKHINFL